MNVHPIVYAAALGLAYPVAHRITEGEWKGKTVLAGVAVAGIVWAVTTYGPHLAR